MKLHIKLSNKTESNIHNTLIGIIEKHHIITLKQMITLYDWLLEVLWIDQNITGQYI